MAPTYSARTDRVRDKTRFCWTALRIRSPAYGPAGAFWASRCRWTRCRNSWFKPVSLRPLGGRSVRAAIEGAGLDRPFVVSEISEFGQKDRQGRMLRTRRYKYVVFNGGQRPEQLFDLELDPGEVQNLARRPAARAVLEQHRKLLADWIMETRDDFRPPPPS
jgi:hypothetical protein